MKVGENPLYTMLARYLELATEVVLEPIYTTTLYPSISKVIELFKPVPRYYILLIQTPNI